MARNADLPRQDMRFDCRDGDNAEVHVGLPEDLSRSLHPLERNRSDLNVCFALKQLEIHMGFGPHACHTRFHLIGIGLGIGNKLLKRFIRSLCTSGDRAGKKANLAR